MLKHLMLYMKIATVHFYNVQAGTLYLQFFDTVGWFTGWQEWHRACKNFLRVWSGSILVVMNGYRSLV